MIPHRLMDCYANLTMGMTAENIARQYQISRIEQDDWAGISQVRAEKALHMAGIQLTEVDLFEINEAYSAQILAVMRDLKLDPEKTNVNGGAIAIGHPLGASGTRVTLALAYELRRKKLRYGVASLCIGGGQGIAIVIENPNLT